MACELGSRFHIGNLIKKHIYLRNKSIKDVADYLGMSEKTFSDHIGSYEIKSDELFKLANYLEISLDYINDIFNGNCSLYGLMVFRLSKLQHIIAHDIVESHISKIKVYAGNDITYIIDELRKTFKGLGYVIDALLPLECEDNVSYRLYVNESNDRGNINSGEFIIFPPYGKSQDVFNYNEYLKGQSGKEFLKIYLKEHFENSSYNQADYLEAIHSNYNDITENNVKRFWNGRA